MALTACKPSLMKNRKVLVLGASQNPNRYSYLAASKLVEKGYSPLLLSIKEGTVAGIAFSKNWPLDADIDTVTVYLSPNNQEPYMDLIFNSKPKRVIFNPGAENPIFHKALKDRGINAINACTLVLLSTQQF